MKKIILTLAIAFSSFAVFAAEETVTTTVLTSFNQEFTEAQNVKWTAGNDFYKAVFQLNGQYVSAFFSTEGELLGLTRNISSLDLPINLQMSIKKDYSSYWISDLFEVSNADGTEYYITVEKADHKITLKSSLNGKWNSYKRTAKI